MDSSQNKFTFSQRLTLAILPPLAVGLMRTLFGTCRWEVRGKEHWDAALAEHKRVIIAIWHESMALGAYYFQGKGFCALTSHSFDGELATRMVQRFGHTAIRGSSSRGGSAALTGLADTLGQGRIVGFTLDGPRGPSHVAKPGIGILSARTQFPVIPMALGVHPAYRLNSWDSFPIPWPFAHVTVLYGPAILPPPDDSAENVETMRQQAELALNGLHDRL